VLDALAAGGERELELVAACWRGARNPSGTAARLEPLAASASADRLGIAIRHAFGYWRGRAGCDEEALIVLTDLMNACEPDPGRLDRDVLNVRESIATVLRTLGRYDEAIDVLNTLWDDRRRLLGNGDAETLRTSRQLVCALGLGGRDARAVAKEAF